MTFLPPTRFLSGDRDGTSPMALAGRIRTWGEFLAACAGVAGEAPRGGRAVLACEDAWEFAAGLFGLLAAGCTVVVPPNFLPATLARPGLAPDFVLRRIPAPAAPLRVDPLAGRIEFWTSGSTGDPKCVVRELAQVDAEMAMLEAVFGGLLGPGPVVGTVPHHHIYGCFFRLLWPMAAGRTFVPDPCGDPGRFLEDLATPGTTLVSSPAHLSRLPRLVDLGAIAHAPGAIFSSGGPLAEADALAWMPTGVVEIYGSTETGGIAWRRQDGDPASRDWTPLPDVDLAFEGDGALTVTSFRAGPLPVRMEDCAIPVEGGRFALRGRLDRIVKLHEKRIALPEVEAALEAHPWVTRAALVLLEGPRPSLGAVLVLDPAAPADHRTLVRGLRAHLAEGFEGAALPRRWRMVDELPHDDRGKLTPGILAALFGIAP